MMGHLEFVKIHNRLNSTKGTYLGTQKAKYFLMFYILRLLGILQGYILRQSHS